MGFIRGGLLVIASIILLILFVIGGVLLVVSLSLTEDNVKTGLTAAATDVIDEQLNIVEELDKEFTIMQDYCVNNTEYVLSYEGNTVVIPCTTVSEGLEPVLQQGVEDFVDDIYYKEYDCGFWDCLEKTGSPFFLVSKKAQDYWMGKFWLTFGIAVILILLMLLLVENKVNLPIIVGALLAVSSIPIRKLDWVGGFISDSSALQVLSIFFTKSQLVFVIVLVLGLLILIAGIVLRLLKFGLTGHKKITKKEATEMVKKEVEKTKTVKEKKK
ncbi:hypothetical protein ACFLZJ_02205 [Nanoarchaeota archaeon]